MAKDAGDCESMYFRVTAYNRGPEPAKLHIIPQVWFRNTWAWGREAPEDKPNLEEISPTAAKAHHHELGDRYVEFSPSPGMGENSEDVIPELLFTDNDTNYEALGWGDNKTEYVKDGFHARICDGDEDAVNPDKEGTKCAAWYSFNEDEGIPPGECAVVRFKFSPHSAAGNYVDEELCDEIIEQRHLEADEFYYRISPLPMDDNLRRVQRQAFSGMLWCKQYYHFIWDQWANGDPSMPPPPPNRKDIRTKQWKHMHLDDILSMPDSWEYPFFAAWDTAFHCIPLAMIDPEFAKKQLDLFTREWYMHPNGQLPAYEWNFGDVNPPVHAWAVFRTFKIERKMYGYEDMDFLERCFQKLLLNFTWWVNRKDYDGKNIFEGGFLGLDNIGLFNRSDPLPTGGTLEQADSTGWMGFYCTCMLNICLELAKWRRTYEDLATKFFEHFILISDALRYRTGEGSKPLWSDEDGFYYDAISWGDSYSQQMPVRSLVGLIPLYATMTLEPEMLNRLPHFKKRVEWFIKNRPEIAHRNLASLTRRGRGDRTLLAFVDEERLRCILSRMLDEDEFLSPYGIRSLSKWHKENPYSMWVNGQKFEVAYLPGDSDSGLFGGNSNWRGPCWIAVNFLLIESLLRFYMFYGDTFQIECPTGSGQMMHLGNVAQEVQHRLTLMFVPDDEGKRPINAGHEILDFDPHWKQLTWFYEFFDGDTGRGLGASHQTGWTGLIAKVIHDTGVTCRLPQTPRTPSSAAMHYFDDIFTRRKTGEIVRQLRRSMTHRSLSSGFISNASEHGQTHETDESEGDDPGMTMKTRAVLQRKNSIGGWDAKRLAEKAEIQSTMAEYVSGRMKRVESTGSALGADEVADEVENAWWSGSGSKRDDNGKDDDEADDEDGDDGYFGNGDHVKKKANGNGKGKKGGYKW
jgi:hypothetical protein